MTDTNEDQREPHMPEPPVFVSLEELKEKTGTTHSKFNADQWETDEGYAELKRSRGYTYEDVCEISKETLPNYDERLKIFFTEHIHSDEEIRFVVEGSGYFDLRDVNDKWIRVEVTKNDLLIVPAGIYHRFTLDRNNYIKVKRLFVGEPVWTPINRPGADDHPARRNFLETVVGIKA
jgi:1,2-dihydroxy-3-keto-5-methylthiopentene dioxygenase